MQRELKNLHAVARERTYLSNDSGNRLVHWNSLRDLICQNTKCKCCGGDIDLCESTVGIATAIQLKCKSCDLNKRNFLRESDVKKLRTKKKQIYHMH